MASGLTEYVHGLLGTNPPGQQHYRGGSIIPHYDLGGIVNNAIGGTNSYDPTKAGATNGFQAGVPQNTYSASAPVSGFNAYGATNGFQASAPFTDWNVPLAQTGFGGASAPSVGQDSALWGQQANLANSNFASAIGGGMNQATGGWGPASGAMQGLGSLAGQLQLQANGQGPSLAQQQLQQGLNQSIAASAGQMASQRGINPGEANRLIGQNAASQMAGAAGSSANLRMQEQMIARQQLASVLGQQGGMGIAQQQAGTGLLGTAAGAQNAQNATNVQNTLGAQQINAQLAGQNTQRDIAGGQLNLGAQQLNFQNANANAGYRNDLNQQILQNAISNQSAQMQAQQMNQLTGSQNAGNQMQAQQMNANTAMGNANNQLGAEQLNQLTGSQNAQMALGAQQQQLQSLLGNQNAAVANAATNAGITNQNAANAGSTGGGILGGIAGAIGSIGDAINPFHWHDGGKVPEQPQHYDLGGIIGDILFPVASFANSKPGMALSAGALLGGGLGGALGGLGGGMGGGMGGSGPGASFQNALKKAMAPILLKRALMRNGPAATGDSSMSPMQGFQPQGDPMAPPWAGSQAMTPPGPWAGSGDFANGGEVPGYALGGPARGAGTPFMLGGGLGGLLGGGSGGMPSFMAQNNQQMPMMGPHGLVNSNVWSPPDFDQHGNFMQPPPMSFQDQQAQQFANSLAGILGTAGLGGMMFGSGGGVGSSPHGVMPAPPRGRLMADSGAVVPGSARHPGRNVASNDTVDAKLTPGEIVLPLSVTQHPNAAEAARQFVAQIEARDHGYKKVLRAKGGRV